MIYLTQSLQYWLFMNLPDKVGLILFGNLEMFTEEMHNNYIAWCKTDEGKQFLEGGSKYDPNHISVKKRREIEANAEN